MSASILSIHPLDFQWPVMNPFLFCVHHLDYYPTGKPDLSPAANLQGRMLGNDFTPKDGWRMYHGETVPGFPVHPHRGFETITVVRKGFVDHADSHGQAGRYGAGDVQWMTAGSGLQHSEMFPLLNQHQPNPCELFQIWLNLPASKKFAEPFYKMLWAEDVPAYREMDENGITFLNVNVIAGTLLGVTALAPAPDSWAADPLNEVAIWDIALEGGTSWTLPPASSQVNRTLYVHSGDQFSVDGNILNAGTAVRLQAEESVSLQSVGKTCHMLLLQGRPINEPMVQYGPFVMNTEQEIRQAFIDYQETSFGGWPWPERNQTHGNLPKRFARHRDGKEEVR